MEVDLAIVGNGAIGCALALRFAETHPDAAIALLGRSSRVGSASLAAAAMLNVFGELDGSGHEAKLSLAHEASRLWPAHLEALNRRLDGTGIAPVAMRLGTHVVDSTGGSVLDAIARALREHGEPFEEADPTDLTASPARALFLPREGMLSSRRLHAAYDAVLAKCAYAIDADVEAIESDGPWRRLATSAGIVRARVVVIAAGARSQRLLEGLGLGRAIPRVLAGVGVALVLRAPPPRSVIRFVGGPYLVPWDAGRVYAGATTHLMEEGTITPPVGAAASLRAELARHAGPELASAEATETLLGWRPTTRDGLPLIGPTSLDGVWLATGTNRDGLHLSPLIAAELTRCLGTRELPFGGRFLPERSERIASTS